MGATTFLPKFLRELRCIWWYRKKEWLPNAFSLVSAGCCRPLLPTTGYPPADRPQKARANKRPPAFPSTRAASFSPLPKIHRLPPPFVEHQTARGATPLISPFPEYPAYISHSQVTLSSVTDCLELPDFAIHFKTALALRSVRDKLSRFCMF